MSTFSYSRYDRTQGRRTAISSSSRRTTLGYWLPLAVTVTVATVSIAAWIWVERRDAAGPGDEVPRPDRRSSSQHRKGSSSRHRRSSSYERRRAEKDEVIVTDDVDIREDEQEEEGIVTTLKEQKYEQPGGLIARMNDVIRRTPSPQTLFTAASRGVTAAAGAVIGGRASNAEEALDKFVGEELGSVEREGWAEEAERREMTAVADVEEVGNRQRTVESRKSNRQGKGRRKVVAVVVDSTEGIEQDGDQHEQYESILSRLPEMNHDSSQLLVLIHAPHLMAHPLSKTALNSSPESSFRYNHLSSIASNLVEHPTHVLPFTSSTGHVHLLRHISPAVVYLEDSLSGDEDNDQHLKAIENWVGQLVVVARSPVVDEQRKGRGKGVEVVDVTTIEEDWVRRVGI